MKALVALTFMACAQASAAHALTQTISLDTAAITVDLDPKDFSRGAPPLLTWIERSARIVAAYYGQFPLAHPTLRIRATEGEGVRSGTTYGYRGGFIRLTVGHEVTDPQLLEDWVLVHEMIHLALPDVGLEHAWLSEGISVYVEGIARAQAGNRTAEDVWGEQMRSMPKGLPQFGDAGLDHTHTWGRTYWGGALFCLMADVDIHRQTHNRYGLRDALKAILRASGGLPTDWPIERIFQVGDAATGTHVLATLYRQWKDQPVTPDLGNLWRDLGIDADAQGIRLRDDAPCASIRRAIISPSKTLPPYPDKTATS